MNKAVFLRRLAEATSNLAEIQSEFYALRMDILEGKQFDVAVRRQQIKFNELCNQLRIVADLQSDVEGVA